MQSLSSHSALLSVYGFKNYSLYSQTESDVRYGELYAVLYIGE